MLPRRDQIFVIIISVLVLILMTFPYVIVDQYGEQQYKFTGFLVNPQDGKTYLVKIYQGWTGEWRFTLPFTAEPGKGAFLFLFYRGLGHIAHLSQLPILLIIHSTRITGCLTLLWSSSHFMGVFLIKGVIVNLHLPWLLKDRAWGGCN